MADPLAASRFKLLHQRVLSDPAFRLKLSTDTVGTLQSLGITDPATVESVRGAIHAMQHAGKGHLGATDDELKECAT